MAAAGEARQSWRWRLKQFVGLHLRQVPCLHAAVEALPTTCRRRRYQTLGQDEEGDGAEEEDQRQAVNKSFGTVIIRISMLAMIGITVLMVVRNSEYSSSHQQQGTYKALSVKEFDEQEFKRDAPIVLYLGAVELLICGACAQTASTMYTRRKHARRHPRDSTGRDRSRYIKVQIQKTLGMGAQQLYGVGFRSSSDGLECLLIEDIRANSLLDRWNNRRRQPTPEQALDDALGDDGVAGGGSASAAPGTGTTEGVGRQRPKERVHPGAAIVAVNHITADVGMMQVELSKPEVTLWIRSEVYHPSQLETDVLEGPEGGFVGGALPLSAPSAQHSANASAAPEPTSLGHTQEPEEDDVAPEVEPDTPLAIGPHCACLAFEDEEPQILSRWLVCSVIFGWVTILPVLLMQPHEERPRQQLFRQYLLKPCVLIMPVWMLLWLIDSIAVLFEIEILHPFYFFVICHAILPGFLVWYLMQMQVADEKLILEQRQHRAGVLEKETQVSCPPVAVEDPAPALLKEFIAVNPVALVWLGTVAAIPIVTSTLLTPMKTARGRLAQGYINMVYGPLIFLQLAFLYVVDHIRFVDLPKFYLAGFGLLMSVPCFIIWCLCLMCASRYGRQDMGLVETQRIERARAFAGHDQDAERGAASGVEPTPPSALVDLTEALHREWEFIYTA